MPDFFISVLNVVRYAPRTEAQADERMPIGDDNEFTFPVHVFGTPLGGNSRPNVRCQTRLTVFYPDEQRVRISLFLHLAFPSSRSRSDLWSHSNGNNQGV